MSEEAAMLAWCRFVRLAVSLDEKDVAIASALVDVVKASRGRIEVSKRQIVRRLGTGPLLKVSN